jgi:MFS family permease
MALTQSPCPSSGSEENRDRENQAEKECTNEETTNSDLEKPEEEGNRGEERISIDEEEPLLLKKEKKTTVTPHTKKVRFLSLVILASAEFLGGCTLSILAPFYSKEAEDHGLGVSQSGIVFASIFILQIIFVPVFGKLTSKIGSTRLFIAGVFLAGVTNVAFGFLPLIKSGQTFFIASLAMRGLTAVGEAAMNSAVLPLARRRGGVGRECSILSWMETMNGVGTTFGPFIGGILFDCGGFPLPFIVSGGLLVFCALSAAIVLDPSEELRQTREEEEELDRGGNIRGDEKEKKGNLFCSFPVVLGLLITILTGAASQWYQPSLEPDVRKEFNMTSFQASMLFIIDGAVYAVASPLIGCLLDRVLEPSLCLLGGTATIGLGFVILAAPPLILSPSLAQICVGAGLHGLGMSACFIASFTLITEPGGKSVTADQVSLKPPSCTITQGTIRLL